MRPSCHRCIYRLKPCPNPWCEAAERNGDYSPVVRLHHHSNYRGVCTSCVFEGPLRPTKAEAIAAWNTRSQSERVSRLEEALKPFAAMGRVMEARARITFGKVPADGDIVCESSGEVGMGILTMGHFRDADALLPNAPGWRGMYVPPFDRAALNDGGSDAG